MNKFALVLLGLLLATSLAMRTHTKTRQGGATAGGDATITAGGDMTGGPDFGEWNPCDCLTSWWEAVDDCTTNFDEESGCEYTVASGTLWDDVTTVEWEAYCEHSISFGYDDTSASMGWTVHYSYSDDFETGDWYSTFCWSDGPEDEAECEDESGNWYDWEDMDDFGLGDLGDIPDNTTAPPMNFTVDAGAGVTVGAERRRRR